MKAFHVSGHVVWRSTARQNSRPGESGTDFASPSINGPDRVEVARWLLERGRSDSLARRPDCIREIPDEDPRDEVQGTMDEGARRDVGDPPREVAGGPCRRPEAGGVAAQHRP